MGGGREEEAVMRAAGRGSWPAQASEPAVPDPVRPPIPPELPVSPDPPDIPPTPFPDPAPDGPPAQAQTIGAIAV